MAEIKVRVPEGMLKAAILAYPNPAFDYADSEHYGYFTRPMIEAALRWLSENPIVPTDEQHWGIQNSVQKQERVQGAPSYQGYVAEWQRRMFVEPDAEAGGVLETKVPPVILRALKQYRDEHCFDDSEYEKAIDAFLGLAPELKVPEAVRDLMLVDAVTFETALGVKYPGSVAERNEAVIEAYRRGQRNPK